MKISERQDSTVVAYICYKAWVHQRCWNVNQVFDRSSFFYYRSNDTLNPQLTYSTHTHTHTDGIYLYWHHLQTIVWMRTLKITLTNISRTEVGSGLVSVAWRPALCKRLSTSGSFSTSRVTSHSCSCMTRPGSRRRHWFYTYSHNTA